LFLAYFPGGFIAIALKPNKSFILLLPDNGFVLLGLTHHS
jgi:hypothetical protein